MEEQQHGPVKKKRRINEEEKEPALAKKRFFEEVLPAEIWTEIFSYLSQGDRCRCRTVNNEFCDFVSNNSALWKQYIIPTRAKRQHLTPDAVVTRREDHPATILKTLEAPMFRSVECLRLSPGFGRYLSKSHKPRPRYGLYASILEAAKKYAMSTKRFFNRLKIGCPALRSIVMPYGWVNDKVISIVAKTFQGGLEELDISEAYIESDKESEPLRPLAVHCTNLKVLKLNFLSNCEYAHALTDEAVREIVAACTNLERFELSHCARAEEEEALFDLDSRRYRDYSQRFTNALPKIIADHLHDSLTHLDLKSNWLSFPSEAIFQLTNLRTLILRGNMITEFPNIEGRSLPSLTHLDLSRQRRDLASLPPAFASAFPCLHLLDVSANNSLQFPETLLSLSALCKLDISCCAISRLPETFTRLSSLRSLRLRGENKYVGAWTRRGEILPITLLESFPTVLALCTSLTELDLENQLVGRNGPVPQGIYNLVNLRYLNLQNNAITGYSDEGMAVLVPSLTHLNMACNWLPADPPPLLARIPHLNWKDQEESEELEDSL